MLSNSGLTVSANENVGPVVYGRLSFDALDSSSIWVPDNYTTIQEAINNANDGDTILVRSGTYHEDVVVNKTVSLIGENSATTILDGRGNSLLILAIVKSDAIVGNLTVRNTVMDRPAYGISVKDSQNVSLANITITKCNTGLILDNCFYSEISNNAIVNSYAYGIYLRDGSSNNTFAANLIGHCAWGVHVESGCEDNKVYPNNFVDNTNQVEVFDLSNAFNDSLGTLGNYWSNYDGSDTNGDGIGDEYLPWEGVDWAPLMNPYVPPIHLLVPPFATFSYSPETPTVKTDVTFNASESYDIDGNITTFIWDFGDGNIKISPAGKNESYIEPHAFAAVGNYTVRLNVTDNDGLSDSFTRILSVQKMSSVLSLTVTPSEVAVGDNVTITGGITPKKVGVNVTIVYEVWPGPWITLVNVSTVEPSGNYSYVWTTTSAGERVFIRVRWAGDDETVGAEKLQLITVDKALSSITINAEPENVTVGSDVIISGAINPKRIGANVTVQISLANETNAIINATVKSDSDGIYNYTWKPSEKGTYEIKVAWNGDVNTLSADSDVKVVNVAEAPSVLPTVVTLVIIVSFAAILIIVFTRRKH
jgi:parallel beta-helix repeat protein